MGEAEAAARVPARELASIAAARAGGGPLWARRLRKEALGRFEALGLPTLEDEEWRNTPIAPIARMSWTDAGEVAVSRRDLDRIELATFGRVRLVTVNGRFAPELSLLDGLAPGPVICGLERALELHPERLEPHLARLAPPDRPFVALNAAALADGAFVWIPDRTELDEPVHVVHVTAGSGRPALSQPRTLVVTGERCRLAVVETYLGLGDGATFTNAVTEIAVGDATRLAHVRVERDRAEGLHVGATWARQGRDSRLVSTVLSLGAELARLDTGSVLAGEGADCLLGGLYVGDGRRLVDNHTTLDHAVPHGTSHELYKGILAGRCRAVFNGRIIVRPQAQKTDAKQSNRNLILSDEATAFTRPQLEIYANDVRCTHGATIGRMDEDQLFYLRSRGLALDEARATLLRAFAVEILERAGVADLAPILEREVLDRLQRAARGGGAR